MAQTPSPSRRSLLRYELVPDSAARHALDETFAAYAQMMTILTEVASDKAGANLVLLHDLAYEIIRERTGLPARFVTLGLRDFAANRGGAVD